VVYNIYDPVPNNDSSDILLLLLIESIGV
jgi:hypothetical protein